MVRQSNEQKEWIIPSGSELRFEVSFEEQIILRLVKGQAEIFGLEMAPYKDYELFGMKSAIFSYEGATVSIKGKCDVEYLSEESVIPTHLNIHFSIQTNKMKRILVIGTGRTSLMKTLLSYAIRTQKKPIFIDLDVSNGTLIFKGVMGMSRLDRIPDIEDDRICVSSSSLSISNNSFYLFYGNSNPKDNSKLFKKFMEKMASMLLAEDDVYILGSADIEPLLVSEIQQIFNVDLVLVVGTERLFSTLQQKIFPSSSSSSNQSSRAVTLLKVPKSTGLVEKDSQFRKLQMQRQFKQYFYGCKSEYSPFSMTIVVGSEESSSSSVPIPISTSITTSSLHSNTTIQLRRLGGGEELAPTSALPIGASRKFDETRPIKIEVNSNLLYSILAVSWSKEDSSDLADSGIAGFVYVTGIDEQKKQLTILTPCPGKLPGNILIVSNVKWIEK